MPRLSCNLQATNTRNYTKKQTCFLQAAAALHLGTQRRRALSYAFSIVAGGFSESTCLSPKPLPSRRLRKSVSPGQSETLTYPYAATIERRCNGLS
eukprot:TRINITY_DN119116_c0_g1_i1.p1 TRINITY_DN119116_c0_g1~~TRINITY_DN119116_c0_g1_i1.p1  ORF type:complete len:107 (-),score=2.76 TRINITY_DN119116_c0_g1_i1:19-306(-)